MSAVLDAMPGTFQEIAEATGINPKSFRSQVQRMRYANELHIIGYVAPKAQGRSQPILMRGEGINAKKGSRLNPKQAMKAKLLAIEKEEREYREPAPDYAPSADLLLAAFFGR